MSDFSVLIPVYINDDASHFQRALASIWDDQILKPSQVVVVQDGPLSESLNLVLCAWKERLGQILSIVPLEENRGLGVALNEGLKHCSCELVARMDSDDISLPERFKRQVDFMDSNLDVAASSAILEEWDQEIKCRLGRRNLPVTHKEVLKFAKRRSPLSHPLVMFRKSAVEAVGGYPPLRKAQDYGLWSLLLVNGYRLANLPDVLLKMRAGDNMYLRRGLKFFTYEYDLLKFQREINYLSVPDFYFNLIAKLVLRASPKFIKSLAYRFAR
jgi:glycosyltransferase involved in cell wall biosynthesis